MLEPLILVYYIAILLGMLLSGMHMLRRFAPLTPIPLSLQWCLSLGGWAVLITWLGFLGFFRIKGVAEGAGFLMALYAFQHWRALLETFRNCYRAEPAGFVFILSILAISFIPKLCYLYGGFNNGDDYRSIAVTVGFAANHLKPAFPFNFGIPISDGYYSYQIAAFLYSAVAGSRWPSIAVLLSSCVAISFFYLTFIVYLKAAFPKHDRYTILIGLLCITFYGLDIFADSGGLGNRHTDWWNPLQISQMATYHHWVYKYLLALGFGIAAFHSIGHFWQTNHPHWLYAFTAFVTFSLTFGTITGVWLCMVVPIVVIIALCDSPRRILYLVQYAPIALLIAVLVILPQIFTFIGRDTLVGFTSPSLWFSRHKMADASLAAWWGNIRYLWYELGPLLFAGFLAIPLYGYAALRRQQWFLGIMCCVGIVALVGASTTTAGQPDWFWRGSNLLIIVSTAVGAVWLYEGLRRFLPPVGMHVLIYLCLWPGVMNYGVESYLRWLTRATLTDPMVWPINRSVDLHTVFKLDRSVSAQAIILSGRTYFENNYSGYLYLYRNYPSFLTQWIHSTNIQTICDTTQFGSPLPNGKMVSVQPDKSFVILNCNNQ